MRGPADWWRSFRLPWAGAGRHDPRVHAEAVLRETRQFYIALDEDGVVRAWNQAATRIFGWTQEQALGVDLESLVVPPEHRPAHSDGIRAFVRTGRGRGIDGPVQVTARRADGVRIPVELTIWAQRTRHGYFFHALGLDLSERRAHEQVLQVLAEHRRGLLHTDRPDEARRLLCTTVRRATGSDGAWLYASVGAGRLVLTATSSVEGIALPAELRAADDGRLAVAASQFVPDTGDAGMFAGAGLRSVALEPVDGADQRAGVLIVGWAQPRRVLEPGTCELLSLLAAEAAVVAERLELQDRLAAAARTDSLTSLPNRRAFDEALLHELRRAQRNGQPLSLVLLDLNHFKAYNDTYGHPAGDALLQDTARAWAEHVRAPDLLARIGGDEFALVLPDAGERAAAGTIARLRTVTPAGTSLCAGVAQRRPDDDVRSFLQRADADLYRGKRSRPPTQQRVAAPDVPPTLPAQGAVAQPVRAGDS